LTNRALLMAIHSCVQLVLLFALMLAPVHAWTQVSTYGDWVLVDRNHFIRNGTGVSGYAEWNETIADFNGYWLMIHNVTWENYREWWQFETSNQFYIKLRVESAGGNAYILTKLGGSSDVFGLLNTFHVFVGASANATSWEDVQVKAPSFATYGFDVAGWNPEEFQLFIKPEPNQTKVVWIWDVNGKNVAYAVALPIVLDGPATLTLIYEHRGDGYAEGYVADSFVLPALPQYEDFKSGWISWLSNVLGIDLGGAISTLLLIVRLFFEVVRLTVPLLGAVVFLWMMDVIFTAITTGEIRLIGEMFVRIYNFVVDIWNTFVNIIQAIWDLITFWS